MVSSSRALVRSQRKAYAMGMTAYDEGKSVVPETLPSSFTRTAFWDGWYDRKHQLRLGVHGISWETHTQSYWED